MRKLHLICNAHLDPAWLWEIEEGAGEALSTFRIAADFCEEYEGFVFNHNEVILYKWIEEYDPSLFQRIQGLVKQGKWHIMGGWYLQPDCNMPSGESFVRQILLGRNYFREKFGVEPKTAINFDPFGHTRGLVQIMEKSGFDSYIFCRPAENDCSLPDEEFIWVGYDGSEVVGHRAFKAYLSGHGKAHLKVESWLEANKDKSEGLVLWGIGNHGGGPSRIDLNNLKALAEKTTEFEIIHSIPEDYFIELKASGKALPRYEKDLNPWAVGCYTSQIRIKQKHRLLENEIYMLEKMMSNAALQGLTTYPQQDIQESLIDLMIAEFHDILPGSSIQLVEDHSLRLMDHGLEIVSRLKARAFFALTAGQKKAEDGEVPIFIYNPHPYKVKGIFECEFQLPKGSKDQFANPVVYKNGLKLPSQVEKEVSNLYIDWRKRSVFAAELEPGQLNRFDVKIEFLTAKPKPMLQAEKGKILFKTDDLEVVINTKTGLIDLYIASGVSYLKENAFQPIVMEDQDDSWGSQIQSFPKKKGCFGLMSKRQGTRYSGLPGKSIDSVRIVEDGEARTVVEALMTYGDSSICQTYKLPKQGTEIQVDVLVHWNEKKSMLKLAVPTLFNDAQYRGQVAYGTDELPNNGREVVSQKWVGVFSEAHNVAFTCTNDGIYGSDLLDGEMRLSLLRSPGYSALPGGKKTNTMPRDRFSNRMDQGERKYSFWFKGSELAERVASVDREALAHNEKPYALTYFPSGAGELPKPLITLNDDVVQMTAFKKAEASEDYIIRLFEPTGQPRSTVIHLPALGIEQQVELGKFEMKTLRLDVEAGRLTEENVMEY
ncbi:alpha-mannosidase [Paenibacillus sp. yr247]|uniref:glycoside hydrolase family 38 N-terminal domain-containing protein n=1 Tax=Paenibacillus sp. yr247 TaxID=1761880 RepID=UPI00087FD056|nr:alpha-mannosidase [Paenibacillus sp. yr247]SDN93164.1 alpha-mannosidase [Paenibacillus sp. yr247]